jgi:hypothetical protein
MSSNSSKQNNNHSNNCPNNKHHHNNNRALLLRIQFQILPQIQATLMEVSGGFPQPIPLHSKSFPMKHSLIILPFDSVLGIT